MKRWMTWIGVVLVVVAATVVLRGCAEFTAFKQEDPDPRAMLAGLVPTGEAYGFCTPGRLITVTTYAKSASYTYAGAVVYSDDDGPFIWIYYTDKDVEAEAQWAIVWDGSTYVRFTWDQLIAKYPSPCDVPRPKKKLNQVYRLRVA